MSRQIYTPELMAKLVIEILQGDGTLDEIASMNSINPNMLRNWKKEFLENAGRAFDQTKQEKEARRKEAALRKEYEKMLKTICQLILECGFLQDCFRDTGKPVPNASGLKTAYPYVVSANYLGFHAQRYITIRLLRMRSSAKKTS